MSRPRMRPYPQNGPTTIADGATRIFNVPGTFVNVKEANASFVIRVDDTEEWAAAGNRRFKLSDGDAFKKVEVINNSGGNLTFQLEIGFGTIESDDVTITGTVNTDDANTQAAIAALQTAIEAALEEVEVEINDVMTLLQNDQDKRAALTTLAGASYAEASNTTTTVCTALANVSGVIIRRGNAVVGGAAYSAIRINGNPVTLPVGSSTFSGEAEQAIENLFIPAGLSVDLISNNVAYKANAWYEVL